MRRSGLGAVVGWAVGTLLAALPAGGTARAAGPPELVARTIDQDRLVGTLVGLSESRGIKLQTAADERVVIRLAHLVEARWARNGEEKAVPAATTMPANGTRVFTTRRGESVIGTATGNDEKTITIRHPWLGPWPIRLDELAWIGRPGHDRPQPRRLLTCDEQREAHGTSAGEDHVELTNGDTVLGRVMRLAPDGLVVASRAGELEVGWGRLSQVTFGPGAATEATLSGGAEILLGLADGSCVRVRDVAYDGRTFRWVAPGGAQVSVGQERVTQITVRGGRWEWLSDVCPVEVRSVSMLGVDFPPMRDRNVVGGPLTIAGRVYERGIGVHADCTLVYDLGGRYQQFVGYAGLDDDSGEWADVDLRVVVDGQVRFEARHVRRRDGARPIRVDIAGARRLELIVTAGANGDVQDRFDWADAGLVKAPCASGPEAATPATDAAGR